MLNILKPNVTKGWLILLAGIMWSAVGIMLCKLALGWLTDFHNPSAVLIGLGGFLTSIIVYRFGFLHIAERNIRRLVALNKKICLFAFMPWKSYLLVGGMMALGIILRSSSLPHIYLAVIYITIGVALFLSSLHYYPHVLENLKYLPIQTLIDSETLSSTDNTPVE